MYSDGDTRNMKKIDKGFTGKWKEGTVITCKLDLDEGTFKMFQDNKESPCAVCNDLKDQHVVAFCDLPNKNDSIKIDSYKQCN